MKEGFAGCVIFVVIGSLLLILSVIGGVINFGFNKADEISRGAVVKYEEYQEIYNTTKKLNEDLCNMRELKEDDNMFNQFSKAQRVNTIKTNLNRRIEEYNAKSKVWTRSMWKGGNLPYQLDTSLFSCYSN